MATDLLGFITGYAIKNVIKLAAIILGLFIAALAYLEYQRILSVDWRNKLVLRLHLEMFRNLIFVQ